MAASGRLDPVDLKVYLGAAEAWLMGEPMYGVPFGLSSGYFKYAPLAAVAFVPYALIGWSGAVALHAAFIVLALAWGAPRYLSCVAGIWQSASAEFNWRSLKPWLILLAWLALFSPHIVRELMLGNVNLLALTAAVTAALGLTSGRLQPLAVGLLMAVLLCFKPHFAVLPVLWLWQGRWRTVLWTAAGLVACLALPWALSSHADFSPAQWLQAMLAHNAGSAGLNNTIQGLVARLTGWPIRSAWLLSWGALATAAALWIGRPFNPSAGRDPRREHLQWAVALAFIPSMLATDTEHFLFSAPLLAIMLMLALSHNSSRSKDRWAPWMWLLLAASWLPFGLASTDFWGHELGAWFLRSGPLGLANLALIALSIFAAERHLQS